MPNLKGSKTEKNLKDAFASESQANRREENMDTKTDEKAGKCPVVHGATNVGMRSNRDWWPNQLNLRISPPELAPVRSHGEGLQTTHRSLRSSISRLCRKISPRL